MEIITYLFTIAVMAAAVGFTVRGFYTQPQRLKPVSAEANYKIPSPCFHTPAPVTVKDILPLGLICLAYAATAFIGLGDTTAPESFFTFSPGTGTVLELESAADIGKLYYYTGADVGTYSVELSADGAVWFEQENLKQEYAEILKWQKAEFTENAFGIRYIRISSLNNSKELNLGEVAAFNTDGELLSFTEINGLTDEQALVPQSSGYLNSTYFDEIYHVRTAWENINNIYPYEISHPPLGKLIISLGIRLFGLNPFGWRFMGVVFGILMLPFLYIFKKNLFGRTIVAACGTTVFAFDFMHFVQTRIATIDTYAVFFILLMFYFMYRYFVQPYDMPLKKTLPPLFLSGLFFGIGAACKWTVIYGGAGLGLLWLARQLLRLHYYRSLIKNSQDNKTAYNRYIRYILPTLLFSVLFFVIIPVFYYILSYIPYARAKDLSVFNIDYLKLIWDNQKYMFGYHSRLTATHPYESRWWKWLIDLRPILYYLEYFDDGTKSAFGAFGNPLFWWTGLGAILCMLVKTLRGDRLAFIISIGYLSSLLPWVFIQRCTFVYHYFPCTVFLALALSYMFSDLCSHGSKKTDRWVPVFTGLCILMFIVFYPVLTGIRFSKEYTNTLLRWFGGQWPF